MPSEVPLPSGQANTAWDWAVVGAICRLGGLVYYQLPFDQQLTVDHLGSVGAMLGGHVVIQRRCRQGFVACVTSDLPFLLIPRRD